VRASRVVGLALLVLLGATVVALDDTERAEAVTEGPGTIVFTSMRGGGFQTWVVNADGSSPRNLTNNAGVTDRSPAWSPDGRYIALTRSNPGESADIYVMAYDGTQAVNLTQRPGGDGLPAWSPDGERIAYVENDGMYDGEIVVMNRDGTGRTNLTQHPAHDIQPSYSPDGSRIVFASTRDTLPPYVRFDIFVMNADGSNPVNLTNTGIAEERHPEWSPTGDKIVFEELVNNDTSAEVFVINPDGSGKTNVSNDPRTDLAPAWSPDGMKILFTRGNYMSHSALVVMNRDGSDQTVIADGPGSNFDAAWTPFAHPWPAPLPPPPPPAPFSPPPPSAPARWFIPRLAGLTPGRAEISLRRANCSHGRVRRVRSKRAGHVIAQSPRPGSLRPRGARVNLVVGRR
jgi:Tol biopolymer transport system component